MPPFMRADSEGLDTVLERMENAQEHYGERFAPPTILRRLVAQGRLGQQTGQGFYAYPRPDADQPAEVIALETLGGDTRGGDTRGSEERGGENATGEGDVPGADEDGVAIAWLANGQMNSISPQVVEDLATRLGAGA